MSLLISLSAATIGKGAKLFHVSLLANGWDSATLWTVAADDLDAAFDFAMSEYPDLDRADFDDGRDGYEIGAYV